MVPAVFRCDKCDFRGNHSFWDQYVYDREGQLAEIPRAEGWCRDCGSTSIIEDFSAAEEVPAAYPSAHSGGGKITNSPEESASGNFANKFWLARMFESRSVKQARKLHEEEIARQHIQARRKERRLTRQRKHEAEFPFAEEIVRQVIESRRGLNRCLICGGLSVHLFSQSDKKSSAESKWPHFMHPGCGGYLYPEKVQLQIHPSLQRKHYSVDGDFLFEEPFDFGNELFKNTPFDSD